ncbi:alanine dehydrogenase [Corynebacterium felinum]|nr:MULTISPECIES: alanine dehydrogenase [Corynebacterium]MDF5821814.1 alanine dehydrogenase [Corynebacterium felinum]MDO4760510.1 alanine dehydrogenase [Corynebacterium sp.]WJY94729.1 Alanine dehydrogenase [Corynebacterium felinum]
MIVGCPTEVKTNEARVALTPAGARELKKKGHTVLVQSGAGVASGFDDTAYENAGATLVDSAKQVWEQSEMIVKVKEPQESEFPLMRPGLILFTYLHLAAEPEVTRALLERNITAIAYETVTSDHGLPLLAPMSEVAGKLATQVGAYHLMSPIGGSGILMGGVPGTLPANVVVIGAGIAGENAAKVALGMGAKVTIVDINLQRLRQLTSQYGSQLKTLASNELNIATAVRDADLVIGSVLIPGAAAPKLVTKEMIETMRDGSVLVDIAIDQGGCFEGSHPTTHDDPVFDLAGKRMYCVSNMPGAVPRTSTEALTNATLPFVLTIANKGWEQALADDPHLARGLNTHNGEITCPQVTL